MRNRGTFMPCLAVLVVRRAGPERESAGVPLFVAGHLAMEVFPQLSCSLPGHGVQQESSWRGMCSGTCRQVDT